MSNPAPMILGVIEDVNDIDYRSYFPATSIGTILDAPPVGPYFTSTFLEVFESFSKVRSTRVTFNLTETDNAAIIPPITHNGSFDTYTSKYSGGDVPDEADLVLCTNFGVYHDAFSIAASVGFTVSNGGAARAVYDNVTKDFVLAYHIGISGTVGGGIDTVQSVAVPNLSAAVVTILGRTVPIYETTAFSWTGTVDLSVLLNWTY